MVNQHSVDVDTFNSFNSVQHIKPTRQTSESHTINRIEKIPSRRLSIITCIQNNTLKVVSILLFGRKNATRVRLNWIDEAWRHNKKELLRNGGIWIYVSNIHWSGIEHFIRCIYIAEQNVSPPPQTQEIETLHNCDARFSHCNIAIQIYGAIWRRRKRVRARALSPPRPWPRLSEVIVSDFRMFRCTYIVQHRSMTMAMASDRGISHCTRGAHSFVAVAFPKKAENALNFLNWRNNFPLMLTLLNLRRCRPERAPHRLANCAPHAPTLYVCLCLCVWLLSNVCQTLGAFALSVHIWMSKAIKGIWAKIMNEEQGYAHNMSYVMIMAHVIVDE